MLTSHKTAIPALRMLLIFGISCTSPALYAENTTPLAVTKVTKTSDIPTKREFPVNNKINPCINFYEYACSPVVDSFKLRDDRSTHTFSFSDAKERLLEFKKIYFLKMADKNPGSAMESEIKNSYLACMNQPGQQKEELAYVAQTKKTLEKITTRQEFINMVAANITSASQLGFLTFHTNPNLDRPNYNDLLFDTNLMSLPEKSYYKNRQLVQDLKILIEQFFIAIGEESPKQKAQMVFKFEQELATLYPDPPIIQELFSSRTKISRERLIKDYPNLKLEKFLSTIPKHVVIRDIISKEPLEFLEKKLKTAPLEELKNIYLYFQLKGIMDDAYPDYFNKKFTFSKKYLGGPDKRADRQERCTKSIMQNFEKEVDFILLPKLFPNFPKENFIKSIEKIRAALIDQLRSNKWLSHSTKQEALRKITNAKLALVTPNNEEEWDFNPRGEYSTDAPIANSFKLGQSLIDKELKELNGPINTNRWELGPLTVNAFYNHSYNKIIFPVGILQYPFYDPSEPEEINFGAIGTVIGHELGHAIDNHGNNYNADGIFKPWMSNKDKVVFDQKTKYLITQFDKIGHNGKFTLGENIGDLVGLTTAYHAAFPLEKSSDQELKKKFFLQFARTWCEVERPGFTKRRLKTDPHALGYARVNEQIKHQIGFKESYNCKPTDPMVLPKNKRVKIW